MKNISSQRGVGLIEVLVAVLLLSVAVLGFSALQLQAIKATEESLVRTQAISVVRGLAENMRANPLQIPAYQTAIQTPDATTIRCKALTDKCTAEQIAIKEANAAVKKLKDYEITLNMVTCPGTGSTTIPSTAIFSEIKCIIAAWDDTKPIMNDSDTLACATASGVYNSGSTCVIVEAY